VISVGEERLDSALTPGGEGGIHFHFDRLEGDRSFEAGIMDIPVRWKYMFRTSIR
jgi:hypothetical protein